MLGLKWNIDLRKGRNNIYSAAKAIREASRDCICPLNQEGLPVCPLSVTFLELSGKEYAKSHLSLPPRKTAVCKETETGGVVGIGQIIVTVTILL